MIPERSTAAALLLLSLSASGVAAGPVEAAALARIAALTKSFQGTVVFHARNLRTGATLSVDADAKVRTASTIKLPILCALEALVAKGAVRWDERIVLRESSKVSGSGVLHELADGTALTVRDLARLTIAGDRRVQSKSGSLDHLRSDVGIIHTPGGPIAMAITVDGMPVIDYSPDNAGNELIWQISQIVQDTLGRP